MTDARMPDMHQEARDLLAAMPAVEPREPFYNEDEIQRMPSLGAYEESLNDWYGHNGEAVEWLLENAGRIRALLHAVATAPAALGGPK